MLRLKPKRPLPKLNQSTWTPITKKMRLGEKSRGMPKLLQANFSYFHLPILSFWWCSPKVNRFSISDLGNFQAPKQALRWKKAPVKGNHEVTVKVGFAKKKKLFVWLVIKDLFFFLHKSTSRERRRNEQIDYWKRGRMKKKLVFVWLVIHDLNALPFNFI